MSATLSPSGQLELGCVIYFLPHRDKCLEYQAAFLRSWRLTSFVNSRIPRVWFQGTLIVEVWIRVAIGTRSGTGIMSAAVLGGGNVADC